MTRIGHTLALALASALLLAAAGPARPALAQSDDDFSSVDQLLSASVNQVGGGVALVLVKDGRVVYRKGFGDLRPDSVVPVASASKWLSAAVIMSLADEGALALDDPASRFLPSFAGDKAGITIRQMFAHTSGLPTDDPVLASRTLTLREAADRIAQLPLAATPGSEFAYGGVSMQAAGAAAEVAGGKTWAELFEERVAGPLGMSGTDYSAFGVTRNPRIAGGARSSGDAYAAFLTMLLEGGTYHGRRVLSEAAVEAMLSDQTAGARIVATPYANYAYLDPALPSTRYGVGNWLEVTDPQTGEAYENASQGAFGFSPWIDRRRNLAGVFVVYDSLQSAMPVYWELKNRIRALVPPDTADTAPPTVAGVTLSKAKVNRRKDPSVTIAWSSADDRGVASHDVVFAPDGVGFSVPVASGLAGDASSFTWTVPADLSKTKSGVVKVIARDAAGNSGEATSGRLRIK